jgi:NAD-dependent deacetylase
MVELPLELLDRMRRAERVVALTGAGVSAESGVPTFREAQTGLWARYRPEDLATPEAFARNPRMVWQWYAWRRELVRHAEPNAGHLALAALERRIPSFAVVTQNVDGLHQRAGSRKVVELHGNLFADRCFREGETLESVVSESEPPSCPRCGGPVRPGVVWFGENLPEAAVAETNVLLRGCEILLVAGTSGLVWPAAGMPGLARSLGAWVVEINPESTPVSESAHLVVRTKAAGALARLVAELDPE